MGLFQSNMGKLKPLNYIVKENDSFASIARQLYKDPNKAILIPLFNDNVSNENELTPGIKLSLPAAPINIKTTSQIGSKRCNISLTKSSRQMANNYYTKALENFDHDQISQAIENLKTAICLNPKHTKAVEMLDMLKDL